MLCLRVENIHQLSTKHLSVIVWYLRVISKSISQVSVSQCLRVKWFIVTNRGSYLLIYFTISFVIIIIFYSFHSHVLLYLRNIKHNNRKLTNSSIHKYQHQDKFQQNGVKKKQKHGSALKLMQKFKLWLIVFHSIVSL